MKEPITIGQRIVAAVLAHQLGITADRAMKSYVLGRELAPCWDEIGEALLRSIPSTPSGSLPRFNGLHIVRRKPKPEGEVGA